MALGTQPNHEARMVAELACEMDPRQLLDVMELVLRHWAEKCEECRAARGDASHFDPAMEG